MTIATVTEELTKRYVDRLRVLKKCIEHNKMRGLNFVRRQLFDTTTQRFKGVDLYRQKLLELMKQHA